MKTVFKASLLCILTPFITSCSIFNYQHVISYKHYESGTFFYDNFTGYYKDGVFVKHGYCTQYWLDTGEKRWEGRYSDDVQQGLFIWYEQDGAKNSECNYNSKGEYDGKEVLYDDYGDKTTPRTRYWKNGKPWDGKFGVVENGETKYYKSSGHRRGALHIYKDGKLISNSNPSVEDYYISHEPGREEI
jgi:hypothetical protein